MKTLLKRTAVILSLSITLTLLAATSGCRPSPFAVRNRGDSSRATWAAFRRHPELLEPETWLVGKYGIAAGTIEYLFESDRMSTTVRHYFDDHGARELIAWYEHGADREPTFLSLMTTDRLTVISNDIERMRSDLSWSPTTFKSASDLKPNFLRLTPAQIECFQVDSIGTRTFLDRSVTVYTIVDDRKHQLRWELWVWEGISLYMKLTMFSEFDTERSWTSTLTAQSVVETPPSIDIFDLDE